MMNISFVFLVQFINSQQVKQFPLGTGNSVWAVGGRKQEGRGKATLIYPYKKGGG